MTDLAEQVFEPDPKGIQWAEPILDWLADADGIGESPLSGKRSAGSHDHSVHRNRDFARNFLRPPAEVLWSVQLCESVIDLLKKHPKPMASGEDSEDPLNHRLLMLLPKLSEWQLANLFEAAISEDPALDLVIAEQSARLYQTVYSRRLATCEGGILQCLSWNRNPHALRLLVELLVQSPPHDWSATALAISPLIRSKEWEVAIVFPRILDAINHPTVIAPLLDLANFVTRSKMVSNHPALEMKTQLMSLLGGVVERMGVLEEDPSKFGSTVPEVQRVLGESVALSIALCDALALIGDNAAIGKLNQAMELRHRRVQSEAAAALTRLGDSTGKHALIQFASDPATRLRVLRYSEELGIESEIADEWKTPSAIAESELAIWLSQTPQMSLPPTDMELLCQRSFYWPGYNEPQDCFLFRYSYRFPDCEFSNIGIAGPMVHSFAADLGDLPEDDIFAAFAGWCAEHPDIYEVDAKHFNSAQLTESRRLVDHFASEGYSEITPLFLGFFVGERALAVEAMREDVEGVGVTDGLELIWIPSKRAMRPLKADDVYSIFKGRKILRTFNS